MNTKTHKDIPPSFFIMENENIKQVKKRQIKHLVISGGGVTGFSAYGVLRESNKAGFWHNDNIESIYGTSIGAVLAVLLALKYSWDDIDDFFLKRPWQNVFKIDINNAFLAYENRGIYDKKIIEEFLLAPLLGKDFDQHTTLGEFYEKTGIAIYMNTVDLNTYSSVLISHITHSTWTVIDAVYCSACLPVMLAPFLKDGNCYIDGGAIVNYPLEFCINNGANLDEIFGITLAKVDKSVNTVTEKSTLFDYISILLSKIYEHACHDRIHNYSIKYEIALENAIVSIYDMISCMSSMEQRRLFISNGVASWEKSRDRLFRAGNDELFE